MGVTGLWRLIEPAGKPVPVETLENKVLAVDISIWLHQMVKGYQDAKGAPLANAHLIGLFQRLCKLLYFRVKPVFVFDGAFPELKRETIAKRQDNKIKYNSESARLKRELALLLSKKSAISSLLGKQISPKKNNNPVDADDMFKLPALPQKEESESESDDETSSGSIVDLHSVDMESDNFKKLPVKEKYDLLIELKETRKMNSWGKLHELPKDSDNFSDFQMQRLLKRRKVQECLQETEKEMGDRGMSLNELESLLNEEGIETKIEELPKRIASNNTTRFLLINNVKQALADARKKEAEKNVTGKVDEDTSTSKVELVPHKKDELEEDLEKAIKLSLGQVGEADISASTSKTDESWTTCDSDTEYGSDSEEEDGFEPPDMSSAKAYIMQYSDFTDRAIDNIISKKTKGNKIKSKNPRVNEIIQEIYKEKSVILDKVDLSSDEDVPSSTESKENVDSDDFVEVNNDLEPAEKQHLISTQSSIISIEDPVQEASMNKIDLLPNEHVISSTEPYKKAFVKNPDDIVEANKIISESLEINNLNATQASVICIEDAPETIVTLDSSSDESFDNVTNTISTVNNTINETNVKKDDGSSSSDEDFEEVPEESESKTVIQLTLDVNEKPEDDIFADIFEDANTLKTDSDTKQVKLIKNETEVNPNLSEHQLDFITIDEEDEELQKAIKMSLECGEIEQEQVNKDADLPEKEIISKSKGPSTETFAPHNKAKPTVSRTQESLDIIQSDNASKIPIVSNKITVSTPVVQEVEPNNPPKEPISEEKLNQMAEEIESEEQGLIQEKGRLDRIGRNITEQMTKEAQELLQIFGIPYIVAPMEAEAQCAFLESVKLTDGTITDDSDIWLFGGRTVYKNFFNQKKHVLQFLGDRIEKSFNLNREQLILLALLVGSDYTTGLTGVGPVTALEILASFPFNKKKLLEDASQQSRYNAIIAGLQEFKQWVRAGKRTDNTSLKKKLKNVTLTDDFPSVRVVQAYLEPNIEKSEEKFTWGELDITILRDYTKTKFGWSQNKLDEIIKPVLKRLIERRSQKTVHDYFKRKIEFQSLDDQMSKRVKAAVQRMGPETPLDLAEEPKEIDKPERKRKSNKDKVKAGPSKPKQKKTDNEDDVLKKLSVKIAPEVEEQPAMEIKIHKTNRYQEIIPQREKDKQSLLQNKMKAIEMFRKTNIDKKKKVTKRKPLIPKAHADLSESDSD